MLRNAVSLIWVALASATLLAADWPIFRGNPLQTGISTEKLPDQLEILWKFETKDAIEGTAAIAGNTVFVASMDEHLYALDLLSGQQKWKYKGGYFKAHVSYHDGAVYVGDLDGIFHCVDADKGSKRWTFKTDGEIQSGANFANGNVLFGSGDEHIYCLNKEGKEVWKFQVPGGPVMGTPAIVQDRTFAAGCDSNLTVLDLKGKSLGSVDLGGQVGASVAVAGDRLFIGTMSNEVLAIDWTKKAPAVAWKFEPEKRQPFYSSAAVTDKYVIIGGRDKNVWAIDRATGKGVWKFPTEGKVDASPVVAGPRVYAGSFDNHFYVIDLDKGEQIQKLNLGSPIGASPALGGGRLVVGTDKGVVFCLGKK